MAVRTPHTVSIQTKGDISHLGSDFGPASQRVLCRRPQPLPGPGPTADYRPGLPLSTECFCKLLFLPEIIKLGCIAPARENHSYCYVLTLPLL